MIDLSALASLAGAGVAGGGVTIAAQMVVSWFASRSANHRADRDADIQIDAQQNKLTFDLLTAARADSAAVREELAELRVISARAVRLEESLDHLEAILTAPTEEARHGAEQRARAFLKRMRPSVGDLRQEIQKSASAREIAKRVAGEPEGELP